MAQAGTQFSEGEKNATLIFSFFEKKTFGQLPRCFAGPSLLTDPQILERWVYAVEVHLGKSVRAKDFGLECMRGRATAFVNCTRWIGFPHV